MNGSASNVFRYDIDASDRIVWVSTNWDAFALSNGGWNSCAGDVLNRPLMDFITGDEARIIWRHLLAKVRKTGHRLSLPYRCDGPAIRRFMEMTVHPLGQGGVSFVSTILHEEKRQPVALLDIAAPRGTAHMILCSWCNRTKADGNWIELDEAVRQGHLFSGPALPPLTHGICEDCAAKLERLDI